jgi:glycosyltransferase involved in cell wall biosynthesis
MTFVTMNKISAVIITFNEERNIERCLQSLQGVVDEIIVLDSYSTDVTERIANQFNVNFIQRKWEGYSASKNYANSLATNDIIFSIDADECLSDELKKSIQAFKQQDKIQYAELNRLTNYCGTWIRHCGWYPDKKVRIFNRHKTAWQGTLHETLQIGKNENLIKLQGNLLHYSYYAKEDHFKQIEKFTDIAANDAFANGKRSNITIASCSAIFKFIQSYFLQLGILDGRAGYLVCQRSAYASYLKYYKIVKLQHANKP